MTKHVAIARDDLVKLRSLARQFRAAGDSAAGELLADFAVDLEAISMTTAISDELNGGTLRVVVMNG
jgi:hypothetical protein